MGRTGVSRGYLGCDLRGARASLTGVRAGATQAEGTVVQRLGLLPERVPGLRLGLTYFSSTSRDWRFLSQCYLEGSYSSLLFSIGLSCLRQSAPLEVPAGGRRGRSSRRGRKPLPPSRKGDFRWGISSSIGHLHPPSSPVWGEDLGHSSEVDSAGRDPTQK